MENKKQSVGKRGEDEACFYLQKNGHRIIARNWRDGHYELDIISLTEGVLHIVEVKTRTAPAAAPPELNVDYRKRSKIVAGAKRFLHSKEFYSLPAKDLEVIFDVITVVIDNDKPIIEYYTKAFIPTYV